MFAILRSGDMLGTDVDAQGEWNQRFLDIINCITGASYSFAKFSGAVSYVNSATPSGWSVVWTSVPLNSFGETGDIQVLLRSSLRISGKYAYFKLYKTSAGYLVGNTGNTFNETTGAISSGGEHSNFGAQHSIHNNGWTLAQYHLSWLQDLTIKAIPGVLLFNWWNQQWGWRFNAGIVERTATAPYEPNTQENSIVPFFGANHNTHISRMYMPSSNTYEDTSSRAHTPNYGMFGSYPVKLSRDASGNKVLPLTPIIYTDPRVGYVGGNLSTYSGLYRTADHTYHSLDNNSTFSYDSKTYRLWIQTVYNANYWTFAVEEK